MSISTRRRAAARLAALLPLALAACGGDSDGPEVWRLAIEETEGSVQHHFALQFEERIEAETNGAVDVKVYPYGSLGTSDAIAEQARAGALQFAMASPGHFGKSIPELQALLLHFVLSDDEAVNRAALDDPEVRGRLEALFPEKDLELLGVLQEGWMVWTTRKPIEEPADFEGVKIRTMTSPLLLDTYEAYGASPQALPYGEVYSSLQLNMIDAQVNPMFAIEEMSFHEVTSHLVKGRPAPFLTTFVAHAGFMGAIDPERAALVRRTVRELEPEIDAFQAELNATRQGRITEDEPELVVSELTEEQRAAFRAASLPIRERYVELAGAGGEELLTALLAAVERARADAESGPR